MPQPLTQARVCFLEQFGEDEIMEMIANGKFLDEVAGTLDHRAKIGITRPLLSRWLSGKLKRNVALSDGTAPETAEQAALRGKKYEKAKKLWAEAIVQDQAKKLFDETNDKMANLRKAQAEFALKIAGIHDRKYVPPPSSVTAVQVNVDGGAGHLSALRRRLVRERPGKKLLAERAGKAPDAEIVDATIVEEDNE